MKKNNKIIIMMLVFFVITTLFSACKKDTDVPVLPPTDDGTLDSAMNTSLPSTEVLTENETIFTSDISRESKEKALEQIYKIAKMHFASWDTFTLNDWEAAYPTTLERALATDNIYDFYMVMKQFVVLLNDHHSQVLFPKSFYDDIWITPIQFIYIDNGYYIFGGDSDELKKLPMFSKIVKIDGIPIESFMEQNVFPYIWHAKLNTAVNIEGALFARFGSEDTCQSFEVLTLTGKTVTASIDRVPFNKTSENWIYPQLNVDVVSEDILSSDSLTIKRIDNDYIYVFIPHFISENGVSQFEAHLDTLKEAKGIIIDVRSNMGGNSAYAARIARHFINGTFPDLCAEESVYDNQTNSYSLHEIPSLNKQGIGDITVPVIVLQDYLTFSSGEHFLDFMSFAQNAKSMGTESAGGTGDSKRVALPEDGVAYITYNKIFRHDKTPLLNIGIQPDIFIENTIEDYINGYDRIFDLGLTELKKCVMEKILQ